MSEHDKRKRLIILDEFHENLVFNNNHINLQEVDTNVFKSDYLVGKKDDLKGSSIKTELIKEHMKKKDIVLFDEENEFKGIAGTGKPFVKKLIDLNNCETTTFNPFDTDNVTQMMKNGKIKAIIHDFYESQQEEFDLENVRLFMWKLEIELASKDEYVGLDDMETILFFILLQDGSKKYEHAYSDELVNEFKNVLSLL